MALPKLFVHGRIPLSITCTQALRDRTSLAVIFDNVVRGNIGNNTLYYTCMYNLTVFTKYKAFYMFDFKIIIIVNY